MRLQRLARPQRPAYPLLERPPQAPLDGSASYPSSAPSTHTTTIRSHPVSRRIIAEGIRIWRAARGTYARGRWRGQRRLRVPGTWSRCRPCRQAASVSQVSTDKPGTRRNSERLCVIRGTSQARAWAAIQRSLGADRLADRTQVSTEPAVLPGRCRVHINHLNSANEIAHGGEALFHANRKPRTPLQFAQHDDRDAAIVEGQSCFESFDALHRVDAGIRVKHGFQSNGSRSSSGNSPLRISGVAASKSSGKRAAFRK